MSKKTCQNCKMDYYQWNAREVPDDGKCHKCGISFEATGAKDRTKGPGDSFSLTYWH